MHLNSVCVYCGSGFGSDPAFKDAALAVGRALGEAGINLVYGGGNVGNLGGVVAEDVGVGGFDRAVIATVPPLGAIFLRHEGE